MIVVGLTGSIGMGKSTVANLLRAKGVPVLDADRVVHDLYAGQAVPLIEAAFAGTTRDGAVDRGRLAQRVLASKADLQKLEAIVHPLVRQKEWAFLAQAKAQAAPLAVLEIPLLFETASHALFDAIVVASAPEHAQRVRVLARAGMTLEKFEAMLARQWPDAVKREKADFVVDTGLAIEDTDRQIDALLQEIGRRPARVFAQWADRYGQPQ